MTAPTELQSRQQSEAEKAMASMVRKILARMNAVVRTQAAMNGEVTDETAAKHQAWLDAVEAWNLLPYELAADHKRIAAAIRAEAKQREEEAA